MQMKTSGYAFSGTYSSPQVDKVCLWVDYNKIPMYIPLKRDYSQSEGGVIHTSDMASHTRPEKEELIQRVLTVGSGAMPSILRL